MNDATDETPTAHGYATELARWYYETAKLCLAAAERTLDLTEDSPLDVVDSAMCITDQVRIRIASLQSAERVFRTEFPRLYIDRQVERILTLEPDPKGKAAGSSF
jgi:hypothetical protein